MTLPSPSEERILVLAPTGRDAALTCKLLERAGMSCAVCSDVAELCRVFEQEGAAALMVAEEVFVADGLSRLRTLLQQQSPWSDVPVLIFTGIPAALHTRQNSAQQLVAIGNVTLLDRPLRPVTMVSATRTALRARRRQYEARAELHEQQRAVRQRDQFLAMLGHELRNPLSALAMALDLDGAGNRSSPYRDTMLRQVNHLTHLVDDLLDVSRVTSGKIMLRNQTQDLVALTQRCVSALVPRKGTTITVEHTAPVWIHADSVRIEQVINNLIHNAVKYTPDGGQVVVRVRTDADHALLEISDTGIGLAPDMIDQVFELFTQAEGSLDRSQGGMGIGLTLVRSLVELHGGTVAAASPGLGQGSVFTVRLPRAQPVVTPEPAEPTNGTSSHVSQRRPAQPGYDVLIIEDNDDSRELLATLVSQRGYRVATAADGPTGIAEASLRHPRVLLVDIGLPGLDGYGVARQVRKQLGAEVFMVALTGYGQPEDRTRATDAGFDVHLTKPVDIRVLETLLAEQTLPTTGQ